MRVILLAAHRRIGEEIERTPKAVGGDRKSNFAGSRNSLHGRNALDIPKNARSQMVKLANIPVSGRTVEKIAQVVQAAETERGGTPGGKTHHGPF